MNNIHLRAIVMLSSSMCLALAASSSRSQVADVAGQ